MILLSYSGGKDSTAMLLYAIELGVDFIAAYQDTGFEHPIHYEYLDYIEDATGVKINRIKSRKYNGLVDMIEKKQAIPNRIARFCTDNLKTDAMKDFIRMRGDISEVWVGVRAGESDARAKRYEGLDYDDTFPLSTYPQFGVKEFGKINCRLPIVNWSINDVWEIHEKQKVKRNPLYQLGDARVGCYPCVLSSEKAWYSVWQTAEGKKNIYKLAELEEDISKSKGSPRTFKDKKTVYDLISKFKAMDSQQDMFPDLADESQKCSWCSD